jgi:hypothetical protein
MREAFVIHQPRSYQENEVLQSLQQSKQGPSGILQCNQTDKVLEVEYLPVISCPNNSNLSVIPTCPPKGCLGNLEVLGCSKIVLLLYLLVELQNSDL